MLNKFLTLALALAVPVWAMAGPPMVRVTNPYAPVSITANGVAYFTITSAVDDTITAVTSPCCAAVELHTHAMEGDVMRMRRVERLGLQAGEPTTLAPGGLHVMLIGLTSPLKAGDTLALTLHFAQAADYTVKVPVLGAPLLRGTDESPTDHHHHN